MKYINACSVDFENYLIAVGPWTYTVNNACYRYHHPYNIMYVTTYFTMIIILLYSSEFLYVMQLIVTLMLYIVNKGLILLCFQLADFCAKMVLLYQLCLFLYLWSNSLTRYQIYLHTCRLANKKRIDHSNALIWTTNSNSNQCSNDILLNLATDNLKFRPVITDSSFSIFNFLYLFLFFLYLYIHVYSYFSWRDNQRYQNIFLLWLLCSWYYHLTLPLRTLIAITLSGGTGFIG